MSQNINEATIPVLEIPSREDFKGMLTPEEANVQDPELKCVLASINRLESKIDWCFQQFRLHNQYVRHLELKVIELNIRCATLAEQQSSFNFATGILKPLGLAVMGAMAAIAMDRIFGK